MVTVAYERVSQSGDDRVLHIRRSVAHDRKRQLNRRSHRRFAAWFRPGWVCVLAWLTHLPPIRRSILYFFRDLLPIEGFRIKPSADPFQHLFVLLLLLISDCFKEIAIDPDLTSIFRRAGSLTFQTERMLRLGIDGRTIGSWAVGRYHLLLTLSGKRKRHASFGQLEAYPFGETTLPLHCHSSIASRFQSFPPP